jgi:hypothetical protein
MLTRFRWNGWNREHLAEHGVWPDEAEDVVRSARPPYPRHEGHRHYRGRGQTREGYYLQAIYLIDANDTIYVIHARPLTENEKRLLRRGRRR